MNYRFWKLFCLLLMIYQLFLVYFAHNMLEFSFYLIAGVSTGIAAMIWGRYEFVDKWYKKYGSGKVTLFESSEFDSAYHEGEKDMCLGEEDENK